MQLPRQVQEAQERSDQLFAERNTQAPTADPPAPGPPPSDSPPPVDQPKTDDPKREDWRAKYFTLQGMYNADVPRLQKDLKAATARIDALTAEIATLKAKPVNTDPPKPAELPQALIDAIGPEAADAISRIIEQRTSTVRDDLSKQIGPLKESNEKTAEQLAADRAEAARGSFMRDLLVRVPDWQAIDAREDWRAFLAERDAFSRRVRQELLTEAANEGDLDAVVVFFEEFKKRAGVIKPPAESAKAKPTAHLEVPPVAGRSAAPAGDKRTWTQKQIREFYADVAKGGIYSRERAMQIEQDIDQAHKEGRVR